MNRNYVVLLALVAISVVVVVVIESQERAAFERLVESFTGDTWYLAAVVDSSGKPYDETFQIEARDEDRRFPFWKLEDDKIGIDGLPGEIYFNSRSNTVVVVYPLPQVSLRNPSSRDLEFEYRSAPPYLQVNPAGSQEAPGQVHIRELDQDRFFVSPPHEAYGLVLMRAAAFEKLYEEE